MKKVILIAIVMLCVNSIYANSRENTEKKTEKSSTKKNKKKQKSQKLINPFANLLCAQVQLEVRETYTPTFGPDRANAIAVGAWAGCMLIYGN